MCVCLCLSVCLCVIVCVCVCCAVSACHITECSCGAPCATHGGGGRDGVVFRVLPSPPGWQLARNWALQWGNRRHAKGEKVPVSSAGLFLSSPPILWLLFVLNVSCAGGHCKGICPDNYDGKFVSVVLVRCFFFCLCVCVCVCVSVCVWHVCVCVCISSSYIFAYISVWNYGVSSPLLVILLCCLVTYIKKMNIKKTSPKKHTHSNCIILSLWVYLNRLKTITMQLQHFKCHFIHQKPKHRL